MDIVELQRTAVLGIDTESFAIRGQHLGDRFDAGVLPHEILVDIQTQQYNHHFNEFTLQHWVVALRWVNVPFSFDDVCMELLQVLLVMHVGSFHDFHDNCLVMDVHLRIEVLVLVHVIQKPSGKKQSDWKVAEKDISETAETNEVGCLAAMSPVQHVLQFLQVLSQDSQELLDEEQHLHQPLVLSI